LIVNPSEAHKQVKMVSNRLGKVTKAITKRKGKTPNLHEGSRDTQRLQAAAQRDDKLNRLTSLREKQNKHYRASRPS
jgi:translation machinery-associated protein 16